MIFKKTGKKILFLLLLLPAFTPNAPAQIRLARLFSDHAVLQRQKPIPVWGWTKPGEKVSVTFSGQTLSAQADPGGKWQVVLPARAAGGPYTMDITSLSGNLQLVDLLVGDVWLCSGQSNMEWTVAQSDNYRAERKNADFPQIRHFKVEHEVALQPKTELPAGEWKVCAAETVGAFTGVGFFFAREVFQKTGIPIGLLHTSWGGSQVEGWISRDGMSASEELRDYAQKIPQNWTDADLLLERNIKKRLLGDPDARITLEDERQYLQENYDISGWLSADPMGSWDWKGIWAWRGNGFMARALDVPEDMINRITTLGLAEHYGYSEVYINGRLWSAGISRGVRQIILPPGAWHAGVNRIAVKMNKVLEPEWFGLGLMGTSTDLYLSADNYKISLAGSAWKMIPAFAEPHFYAHSSNNVGCSIYNAMIAPLLPYSLCGALWYQGESNSERAYQYRTSFPLMIEDWRRQWKDDFPFYFVQLSSFGADQNSNQGSNWAELREAQTMALALPNTGMAVTTDIGNPKDIHPTNKQDVGKRLAAHALKFVYGYKNLVHTGPTFQSVQFEKEKAIVSFQNAGRGLVAKDRYGYLKGFEIAGEDRVFYYAKAAIEGEKVLVSNSIVSKPVAVRYGWSDAPEEANLFNAEGFPACPFRTDAWEGKTLRRKFE